MFNLILQQIKIKLIFIILFKFFKFNLILRVKNYLKKEDKLIKIFNNKIKINLIKINVLLTR
ncbi:MAG: hypothetical protein RIR51_1884 [Bacteroidota bacterium]|jgi:hypothetical protein